MLYIFYMHFTLIVSVFMLSICDTEINQSINQFQGGSYVVVFCCLIVDIFALFMHRFGRLWRLSTHLWKRAAHSVDRMFAL